MTSEVTRRNHYDVTDRVFLADPRSVCAAVCELLHGLYPSADLRPVAQAFDQFSRLYAGTLPGYLGCETWYHDAQHSLDCALAMARLMDGHERSVPAAQRLDQRRVVVGVIAALFHDAGYIRSAGDSQRHGAEFTLSHVRRSGDFLAHFLPTVGFAPEARVVEQLVHYTGYEMALDDIDVADPLDRRLGFMLGTADVLAQMSDRCYLEKCRDFLYAEFEICGLAGAPRDGARPIYSSREELLGRTHDFRHKLWSERIEGHFEGVQRYAAVHFGGRNLYEDVVHSHMRRLHGVLRSGQLQQDLRRRCEAINAEPLRAILGMRPAEAGSALREALRAPRHRRIPRRNLALTAGYIPI
ncbi:MAG: hypothetical protein P4L83_03320 [Nevskia sp.]|nr:hypothetical protein [Nevskia sp.]